MADQYTPKQWLAKAEAVSTEVAARRLQQYNDLPESEKKAHGLFGAPRFDDFLTRLAAQYQKDFDPPRGVKFSEIRQAILRGIEKSFDLSGWT